MGPIVRYLHLCWRSNYHLWGTIKTHWCTTWMKPENMVSERSQLQKTMYCIVLYCTVLYCRSRRRKSVETERLVVAYGWGWGDWGWLLKSMGFHLGVMKCPKIDCGCLYNSVKILHATKSHTLNGWIVGYVNCRSKKLLKHWQVQLLSLGVVGWCPGLCRPRVGDGGLPPADKEEWMTHRDVTAPR